MHNDRYPDMVLAPPGRARAVPVNVNHHYATREVGEPWSTD